MEAVFSRFDSYDFAADERFREGLRALSSGDENELVEVKLFFYNRFVEPIDRSSYRQRRRRRPAGPPPADPAPSSGVVPSRAAEQAPTEGARLSFAEVMRLVRDGKEVPGVTDLDVQPTNQSPAPSRMERTRKPWETPAASE